MDLASKRGLDVAYGLTTRLVEVELELCCDTGWPQNSRHYSSLR